MLQYKRIGITVKSGLSKKSESVLRVATILKDLGAEILIDQDRLKGISCTKGHRAFKREEDIDLLIVIGGDGTILRAVREFGCFSIPILSVNRGTVGFLAEANMEEAKSLLPALLLGKGIIDERRLLHVEARRGREVLFKGAALNEAVIAQGMIVRLMNLKTTVNGEPLTTYHSDGLILSTPTGSTAYNLAAGGPIVHPQLSATILTPLNPHSFTQKPVVIRADSTVDVEVEMRVAKFEDVEVTLTIDGQVYIPLKNGDHVSARLAEETVRFLRRAGDTFFGTLREKLKWGERLEA